MDCLGSAVRLKLNFDLALTLVAELLYRELARQLKGFGQASPQRLYRKFMGTAGSVELEEDRVRVRLSKRAHNPALRQAGLVGRACRLDRCRALVGRPPPAPRPPLSTPTVGW